MKVAWLGVALVLPLLSGCLDFLGDDEPDRVVMPADVGHDPQDVTVTGFATEEITIQSGDAALDTLVYVPQTTDAPDGEAVQWPLVVLLHGWGFPKETYTNMPQSSTDILTMTPSNDLMAQFAEGGLLTVAYDARGWYRSTGTSTVGGHAELNDLRTVIDHIKDNYPVSENIGVAGLSYGGGQALRAWAEFEDVVTAVSHQGWVNLFEGLAPGNALKLEWAALQGAGAVPGTHVTGMPQEFVGWGVTLTARQDAEAVDAVHAAMDARSVLDDVTRTKKPLFTCQGMQETLFPQSHLAWQNAPGFTRAHYFEGGHNTLDKECWDKTMEWFQFFLGGHDTGIDAWPKVTTVDHNGDGTFTDYSESRIREINHQELFLHGSNMVGASSPNQTFTISQQVVANPIHEPNGVWDTFGGPYQAVPEALRQDPTAEFFASAPMDQTGSLLGAPTISLELAGPATPFQVVATLYHDEGSTWRMLGRGATSPLTQDHLADGRAVIHMPWMKADLNAGDSLVLKLDANDETAFAPLPANFAATFSGNSTITVPFFAPEGSAQ